MANFTIYVLAIDLGTSGPKVALATLTGEIIDAAVGYTSGHSAARRRCRTGARRRGGKRSRALHHELLARNLNPCDIKSWLLAAQRSGRARFPWTEEGNALANAIIWMDARGAKYLPKIVGGPLQVAGYRPDKLWKWIRLTGGAPSHSGKDSTGAHPLFEARAAPSFMRPLTNSWSRKII